MSAVRTVGSWIGPVNNADRFEVQGNTVNGTSRRVAVVDTFEDAMLIACAPDLLQELRNIAIANTFEWDDRTDFEAWAKNRARAAITAATGSAS